MGGDISIKGLDKADLLAAFYNSSQFQGYGKYDPEASPESMTKADAQRIIARGQLSFDYLRGRILKIDIGGDMLNPFGFDRDLGQGASERVVEGVKKGVIVPAVNLAARTYGL